MHGHIAFKEILSISIKLLCILQIFYHSHPRYPQIESNELHLVSLLLDTFHKLFYSRKYNLIYLNITHNFLYIINIQILKSTLF